MIITSLIYDNRPKADAVYSMHFRRLLIIKVEPSSKDVELVDIKIHALYKIELLYLMYMYSTVQYIHTSIHPYIPGICRW